MLSLDTSVLAAHPSTPNEAVRGLGVRVRAEQSDMLVFDYSLDADMSRIRVPPPGAGGPADALWKHTCFEAFVASADAPGYHEFNFSPSCDWAIYRFSAYREGMSPAEIGEAPQISVRRGDGGLELESAVRLGIWRTCVTLVGSGSRWPPSSKTRMVDFRTGGLRHAPGKPDFHHPSGFALEIARS